VEVFADGNEASACTTVAQRTRQFRPNTDRGDHLRPCLRSSQEVARVWARSRSAIRYAPPHAARNRRLCSASQPLPSGCEFPRITGESPPHSSCTFWMVRAESRPGSNAFIGMNHRWWIAPAKFCGQFLALLLPHDCQSTLNSLLTMHPLTYGMACTGPSCSGAKPRFPS